MTRYMLEICNSKQSEVKMKKKKILFTTLNLICLMVGAVIICDRYLKSKYERQII